MLQQFQREMAGEANVLAAWFVKQILSIVQKKIWSNPQKTSV